MSHDGDPNFQRPSIHRPSPEGSTAGAHPWWHTRRPANDQERLEYAALTFVPDTDLDKLLVLRERHADLYGMVFKSTQTATDDYERKRAAALEIGKSGITDLSAIVGIVDQLADTVRATMTPPRPRGIMAEHRARFRELIADGADHPAIVGEWTAWMADLEADHQYAKRRNAAWQALSMAVGEPQNRVQIHWAAEYGAAMDALKGRG